MILYPIRLITALERCLFVPVIWFNEASRRDSIEPHCRSGRIPVSACIAIFPVQDRGLLSQPTGHQAGGVRDQTQSHEQL